MTNTTLKVGDEVCIIRPASNYTNERHRIEAFIPGDGPFKWIIRTADGIQRQFATDELQRVPAVPTNTERRDAHEPERNEGGHYDLLTSEDGVFLASYALGKAAMLKQVVEVVEAPDFPVEIMRAWLEYQGYDSQVIENLLSPINHKVHGCFQDNLTGYVYEWVCTNEDDRPNHPEHDEFGRDAELIMFTVEQVRNTLDALGVK